MAVDADLIRRQAEYRLAESAILAGNQSVSINGVAYTRGDLGKIQAELNRISDEINRQSYGGSSNRARFGDRG